MTLNRNSIHNTSLREGGAKSLSQILKEDVRTIAERKGISITRLLTAWPEVVGKELGSFTHPIKVRHRHGASNGGVLVIQVPGPRAQIVTMQKHILIERVNMAYGYAAISDISISQVPHSRFSNRSNRSKHKQFNENLRERCEMIVGQCDKEELREELVQLCMRIL